MQFSQPLFWAAFGTFYVIYLVLQKNVAIRNAFLLLGSYAFYAWWDWRFALLLALSTAVSFCIGRMLPRVRNKKALLICAIVFHVGVLALFKYATFALENAAAILSRLGFTVDGITLHFLLPLGISFYTFSILGYLIEIYQGKSEPERSIVNYALFVAFFPKILSGPIERASHLLPQFKEKRPVAMEKFSEGLFLIVWGLIQKLCIADNAAIAANAFLSGSPESHLITGGLALSLQILADFSGYSDIAKGLGALLGFDLSWNFKLPYFADTPSEFWRRWHITLSQWFLSYVYIPLGGNRRGRLMTARNLLVTMMLVGLWHGARWTFVLWGAYHGVLLILYKTGEEAGLGNSTLMRILRATGLSTVIFFVFVTIGWMLFQSESLGQLASALSVASWNLADPLLAAVAVLWLPFIAMQLFQYRRGELLAFARLPLAPQLLFYALAWFAILYLPPLHPQQFVYVQF